MSRILFFLILISLSACSRELQKPSKTPLSPEQTKQLSDFASKMAESINHYEYAVVRNAWDKEAFKNRVDGLSKTEQTVFDHYYEKELSEVTMDVNIDLINKLKFNNGSIILTKLELVENHAEATFSMLYDFGVDFWKYRIELRGNKAILSDFYSFRDELWQSENMKNIIRLNSKYTATSKERQAANISLNNAEYALLSHDSLKALKYLDEIPATHLIGNALSLKKINIAYTLNDSIFSQVLTAEFAHNKSIYIKYLYSYYFNDSTLLHEVFGDLGKVVGENNAVLDSMKTLDYVWN